MYDIIVIRHGQSEWNKKNLFTGWVDVDLSEQGVEEAHAAAKTLKHQGINFTLAYTSMLKRANKTLDIVLREMGLSIPVVCHWRLNERHYGNLQGKNKQEMRDEYGEEQVHIWRRSFDTRPPQSEVEEVPANYEDLDSFPRGESLKDTCDRVIPYWERVIKKSLLEGEKIIISAHGNSLRALIKHLENIDNSEIVKLEIPTGRPISIKLDKDLNFVSRNFIN